jgi:oligoribonuclease NrnB/cAMP/cGMP phosphodiesterase (DHH superfamily)
VSSVKRTLFYHASCPDGFGAAWAAKRVWGADARYVSIGHEERLDVASVDGGIAIFADICPRNEDLRRIGRVAAQLVVLDHHVTARDRVGAEPGLLNELADAGHQVHFDLTRSGAILAWRYFHRDAAPPPLLRYVEDQDLWAWALPSSEELNAALGSFALDFERWDDLAERSVDELVREGAPILRANRIEVARAVANAHPILLGEQRIEAVNAQRLRAQMGHALAERATFGRPWGVVYRLIGDRVDASIYSIGDLDVGSIAQRFGGGGHRNAAGFTLALKDWMALLL